MQLAVAAGSLWVGIATNLAIDSSCLSNIVYEGEIGQDNVLTLMKPESTWETTLTLLMRASVTNTALITFALSLKRYRLVTQDGEKELKDLVQKMLTTARVMSQVESPNFQAVRTYLEYEAVEIEGMLKSAWLTIFISRSFVRADNS